METRAEHSVGSAPDIHAVATDAIRFWERGRLLYNAILLAIVLFHVARQWPASLEQITLGLLSFLFLLGVASNLLYCLAYLPDLFAQLSQYRESWLRYRWLLLALGTLTASILAFFWSSMFFAPSSVD